MAQTDKRSRRRSSSFGLESVLDEIGFLIKNLKVKTIFDDTGSFPTGKWLSDFCQGMIKREYNKLSSFVKLFF